MPKYVFIGNVKHNGQGHLRGHLCPDEILEVMLAKELVVALPEPIAVEPQPELEEPKKKAHKEKADKK